MKKILLILTSSGASQELIAYALKVTKEKLGYLFGCYIIDSEVPDAVSSWLIYVGFMGDEPSGDYQNVILKEYKYRAEEKLAEIQKLADRECIEFESIILQGSFIEQVLKLVTDLKPELILIEKPQVLDFTRFLRKSIIEELKKQIPCEVEIVDK